MSKIEKIQKNCLKLLDEFISVCDKHKLKWFADGGTLLGAMRKGKMIAWDDDVDVVMPREDYDKLLTLGPKVFKEPFFFQTPETDEYFEVHAKLRLDGTTALTEREFIGHHHRGQFLDIFPIDILPYDETAILSEIGLVKSLGKYSSIKYAGTDKCKLKEEYKNAFVLMNKVIRDIGELYKESNNVANIVFYRYAENAFNDVNTLPHFNKEDYSGVIQIKFENLKHLLNIPIGYDNILTQWYGNDWHIEKQVSNCHSAFIDPDNDYHTYDNLNAEKFDKLLKNC